ncbi:ScnB [Microtetraspora malaysiensis]|uniref:ScnB n=1 Tax=Microtetraspora malaysiensis TaxID=161358 RepID=UPI003D92B326
MSEAKPYEVLLGTLDAADERTDTALQCGERVPAPWESAMQATCECLSWRGSLDNLERRQTEDRLGETVYSRFPVHARSAVVVAHSLMDRGVIDQDELKSKMKEVRARLERE